MSRNITSDVITALQQSEITTCYLFEFTDGSNDYRYTDLDVPIMVATDGTAELLFDPIGFKFESINYSMGQVVDDAVIRIDNLNEVMTALFGENDLRGNKASIWLCVLDDDADVIGTALIFSGKIDAHNFDEEALRLTITSIFTEWHQSSYGKYSALCRWKVFKGVECQYVGDRVCNDRSYKTCEQLGNTAHFGGFKWLPDLENKTIWWGPTPDEQKE